MDDVEPLDGEAPTTIARAETVLSLAFKEARAGCYKAGTTSMRTLSRAEQDLQRAKQYEPDDGHPSDAEGGKQRDDGRGLLQSSGRHRAADQRDSDADLRDRLSGKRDRAADQRDTLADARALLTVNGFASANERDRDADERDDAAQKRDDAADARVPDSDGAAKADRRSAAHDRAWAANSRHAAAKDRMSCREEADVSALSRQQASDDRVDASTTVWRLRWIVKRHIMTGRQCTRRAATT